MAMESSEEKSIADEVRRQRALAEWRVRTGMPEDSPDFSIEDVFDVLEFFLQQEEERVARRERREHARWRPALARDGLPPSMEPAADCVNRTGALIAGRKASPRNPGGADGENGDGAAPVELVASAQGQTGRQREELSAQGAAECCRPAC